MRSLLVAASLVFLAACSRGSSPGLPPATEQALLDSAASDFKAHGPPAPLRFREVRTGTYASPQGSREVMCGEFRSGGGEWTRFVTIRTDPYEQWLGGQAGPWCEGAKLGGEDLAAKLAGRVGE
ncbi:MAG: hypothetical protein U0229_24685 [Anaeromyxobacter sp.]